MTNKMMIIDWNVLFMDLQTYLAHASARFCTMDALVLNKSSRVMPTTNK